MCGLFDDTLSHNDLFFENFLDFDKCFALFMAGVPGSALKKADNGRKYVAAELASLVKRSRDDLSNFIKIRLNDYDKLITNTGDIGKGLIGILWASSGNTMIATYWLIYYLLIDEAARRAVMHELGSVFQSRDADAAFTITESDLVDLKVTPA